MPLYRRRLIHIRIQPVCLDLLDHCIVQRSLHKHAAGLVVLFEHLQGEELSLNLLEPAVDEWHISSLFLELFVLRSDAMCHHSTFRHDNTNCHGSQLEGRHLLPWADSRTQDHQAMSLVAIFSSLLLRVGIVAAA
jgi:hypothetical protein